MIAAGGVAAFSLITIRRRARLALILACIVVVLAGTVFGPAIGSWYTRGGRAEDVSSLNGRRKVWDQLLEEPRSGFEQVFGIGLTNKSFAGLPVDNSWLATYQDSGLFGVVICAATFVSLLMIAATRPRGPDVAVAIFIIFYAAIASWAETGLGDASTYMLDLTGTASLIAASGGGEARWSRQAA